MSARELPPGLQPYGVPSGRKFNFWILLVLLAFDIVVLQFVLTSTIQYIKCFVIYLDFLLNNHTEKKQNKDVVRATTAQLYSGRDTFEFDQGHVTKNQPIMVLILLSESLAI